MKSSNPNQHLLTSERGLFFLLMMFSWIFSARAHAADVTLTIDPTADRHPISRYIYGINPSQGNLSHSAYVNLNLTLVRLGGNRWTAYNWLNNASNAGNDYHYSNDAYLDSSKQPGHAVTSMLSDDPRHDAATIITVPTNGYLAADENGFVPQAVLPQNSPHFVPEYPTASADPKPAPGHVYQDQFIQWIKTNFGDSLTARTTHPIFFILDNEPDLWSSTHIEVHPQKPTYAEIIQRSVAYAQAIKKIAPHALILGPASFGWSGFVSFQEAPDAKADNAALNPDTGKPFGDFLAYYLAQMKAAEQRAHLRLLDMLDVHWYPEVTFANAAGKQVKITDEDAPNAAIPRMNAPRSLWDSSYVEQTWITKWSTGGKPIRLLPWLNEHIAANYPGTKLSMSEYNYGGGNDISGAVAQADTLGLLGKFGLYAACEWPMGINEKFILGAMRIYRNYDGQNATFGDTSISAQSSNPADVPIYASIDSTHHDRLILVAINRTLTDKSATISLQHAAAHYETFSVYQLTASSTQTKDGLNVIPTAKGTFPIAQLASYPLPAESVSTIVLNSK